MSQRQKSAPPAIVLPVEHVSRHQMPPPPRGLFIIFCAAGGVVIRLIEREYLITTASQPGFAMPYDFGLRVTYRVTIFLA
jgi:hypothetical protein